MQVVENNSVVRIVPVIFTTAQLFASSADLSSADLETGQVNIDAAFRGASWLWYQYHVSPGLKHTLEPLEKANAIEEYLKSEHIRSLAVVSPSGIEDF